MAAGAGATPAPATRDANASQPPITAFFAGGGGGRGRRAAAGGRH